MKSILKTINFLTLFFCFALLVPAGMNAQTLNTKKFKGTSATKKTSGGNLGEAEKRTAQVSAEASLTKGYFALRSMRDEGKTISYYNGAANLYMGDTWVLNDDNNISAEWTFERCEEFSKDVFWIQHRLTGKLLSWYNGAANVYAGDSWVKSEPHGSGMACLWRVYRATDVDGYHIVHLQTGKVLSWYPGSDIYVGDSWVINQAKKSNYSSVWNLQHQ